MAYSIKKPEYLIFLLVFVIAISFALFTDHAWEDFYITYRVSKNLATGYGLVYTIGEKVHVFTSPFNVLIPAAFNYITGNRSDALVLWLYRILCCFLLGSAAVWLFKISRKISFNFISVFILIGLLATDAKTIDFSINGQEVAFMVFFITMMLHTLMADEDHAVLKLGLSWAGLMWTRPDAFIYIGSLASGFIIFNKAVRFARSRCEIVKIFSKAAILALALYLPWILWTWYYYGSPIPHTVIAKGVNFYQIPLLPYLENFVLLPYYNFIGGSSAVFTFLPGYAYFGGWHKAIFIYGNILSFVCLLYWIVPSSSYRARAVSFGFYLSHYYLTFIAASTAPWYLPTTAILAIFILANAVEDMSSLLRSLVNTKLKKFLMASLKCFVGAIILFNFILLVCVAYQLRVQQKVIEDGMRKQIGLWLKENASGSDTVFLESLGYIGFFSNLKTYDYPGLSSTEVVAIRKKFRTNSWERIISELKPNWVVRRLLETSDPVSDNYLNTNYRRIKVFDVSHKIASYRFLPGRRSLYYDSVFFIYKRKE